LPARLDAEQVAWVLNYQPHDVPVLVAARLLKPLGNPQPNSVKYFAALARIFHSDFINTWLQPGGCGLKEPPAALAALTLWSSR